MQGTLPVSEEQALASLLGRPAGRISIAALSRDWGWSRGRVHSQLDHWSKGGELPPALKRPATSRKRKVVEAAAEPAILSVVDSVASVVAPAPVAAPTHAVGRPIGRALGIVILAAVGVALAGIGMIETTAFATRHGGLLFAALAVCADALVLLMPSAAVALWRRRSPTIIMAVALWVVSSAVTLSNLSGYIGSNDDKFRTGRENQSTERILAMERVARLRHERDTISEMRPVGALRIAIRSPRRRNKVALGEALAVAQRRDALDAELSAMASGMPALPEIAMIDPSASVLSDISGATISESDLRRARLALLLLLPLCGGFVLTIAMNLLAGRPNGPT